MTKSRLFNIRIPLSTTGVMLKDGDVAQPSTAVGVINANQSAMTFTGAPVVVTIIWKVVGLLCPPVMQSYFLPVGLSLIIGMLIHWQSESSGATTKDKILGFTFALLNSFAIAATVLGINSATGGAAITATGK